MSTVYFAPKSSSSVVRRQEALHDEALRLDSFTGRAAELDVMHKGARRLGYHAPTRASCGTNPNNSVAESDCGCSGSSKACGPPGASDARADDTRGSTRTATYVAYDVYGEVVLASKRGCSGAASDLYIAMKDLAVQDCCMDALAEPTPFMPTDFPDDEGASGSLTDCISRYVGATMDMNEAIEQLGKKCGAQLAADIVDAYFGAGYADCGNLPGRQ